MRSDRNNKHALFQPAATAALTPAQTAELTAAREEVVKVTETYNSIFGKWQDTLEKIKKYQRKLNKNKGDEGRKSFESKIIKLEKEKSILDSKVEAHELEVTAARDKVTALSKEFGIELDWGSPSTLYMLK